MPKINQTGSRISKAYKIGLFAILILPLFTLPPWFFPPDFGKSIIFRSITAIILLLVSYQLLYGKMKILPNIRKNKLVWALLLFNFVLFLASIFSVDPYFSFLASPYRGGGTVTLFFFSIFAFLAHLLLKKEDWKKAWTISIIVSWAVSAIALFQFYGLFNNIFVEVAFRPGSTIGNSISLGIYMLMLFFIALAFAINEKNKPWKTFYSASCAMFFFVMILTGSRASYLGLLTGALIFLFLYPKKIKILKIASASVIIAAFATVAYVNFGPPLPELVSSNRIISSVTSRLSLQKAFSDERYQAWKTVIEGIKDRPILGWGPENLAVGFDKFYDPNVTVSPWWDRAHNAFLGIAAEAGLLGLLAYLLLFIALFWQLRIIKKEAQEKSTQTAAAGLQSVLAGYMVANFFSFDCFATYLIFFLIIAYVLHLKFENIQQKEFSAIPVKRRKMLLIVLFAIVAVFLWQYNILPFMLNTKINIATNWTQRGMCDSALAEQNKFIATRSFLDSYLRMQYVNSIKKCSDRNPEKNREYAQKGIELLKQAVKIQPFYTRYWLFLGSFTTVLANTEQNTDVKSSLLNEAYSYFEKTEKLSPLRAEIFMEKAKTDMIAGNYQKMKNSAQKCIDLKPNINDCYWLKSLAELYMNDYVNAEKDRKIAESLGFNINSPNAYYQLIDFYVKKEQYDKVSQIYEKLISLNPNPKPDDLPTLAQYHASLALAYAKIGQYQKARAEAMKFLEFMPEAKQEVDAFLKTLPY